MCTSLHFPPSIVGLVIIALCLALIHAHVYLLAQKLGILARITLTGAIYQKVGVVYFVAIVSDIPPIAADTSD